VFGLKSTYGIKLLTRLAEIQLYADAGIIWLHSRRVKTKDSQLRQSKIGTGRVQSGSSMTQSGVDSLR